MRYVEHENVVYRGGNGPGAMDEKAVGGEWKDAGVSGLDASLYGMPMDEAEAKKFAGEDWPAEGGESAPAGPVVDDNDDEAE